MQRPHAMPVNDKWIRIGGVALLCLNLFIDSNNYLHRDVPQQIIYIGVYVIAVVVILETGRALILNQLRKYPHYNASKKRFRETFALIFLSNVVSIQAFFYLSHLLRGRHTAPFPLIFLMAAVAGGVLALVQAGVYEGIYYSRRLHQVEQEKEELLRINLQSQFDSLKQQVNPHFLFNSINTVSSLITVDPQKAKKFLAEMSKVYRYLLQSNETEMVTLETELHFIQSYFHLLKTRFNDGLYLNVLVPDSYRMYQLPALTLQLLVENAVKHNIVDKAAPLTIVICVTEEGQLCVKNNLQKKKDSIVSTKVGLANIMARYKLLNQPEVVVQETEQEFTVLLPLIQKHPV